MSRLRMNRLREDSFLKINKHDYKLHRTLASIRIAFWLLHVDLCVAFLSCTCCLEYTLCIVLRRAKAYCKVDVRKRMEVNQINTNFYVFFYEHQAETVFV